MLFIYNSLTGKKERFAPIIANHVRMYVCGMTVYDDCHIGHARVLVVFDMIARYLRSIGYKVTYVRNITDIDDKIIRHAHKRNESIENLTARYIDSMQQDATALNIMAPDFEPRASEHIEQIITMIAQLLKREYAYQAENNDVYFDVSRFNSYGRLSGKKIAELRAGERVEIEEAKDDPLDFVLWKAVKQGEPYWDSPWGPGRPGWHIECSAMSTHCLGNHFDIHGGGQDLQFPHHENEIAQSVCATGEPFANVWIHNGFVRMHGEKVSKSSGNFFKIKEIFERYQPEIVRFFILSSHYRSPLNYTQTHLEEAKSALTSLYMALRDQAFDEVDPDPVFVGRFNAALDNDFNTPEAISVLHELAHTLNRLEKGSEQVSCYVATLKHLGGILGLLQQPPLYFLRDLGATRDADIIRPEQIEVLIEERKQARKDKMFTRADAIRTQLLEAGILLEDTADETVWRRK